MSEKVTLRQMFLYALGWIGFSVFWPFNIARMPLYLNGVLEQARIHDARILGLLLGMTGVFGLVVPFVVGSLSDRIYTRIGRRRPVIFGALPVFACSLVALIAAPALWQKIVAWLFCTFRSTACRPPTRP